MRDLRLALMECFYSKDDLNNNKTMDKTIHPIFPFGKHELVNFAERLLANTAVVLIASVLLERHGIGIRDILIGWLFINMAFRGTVDDILFSWHAAIAKKISASDESSQRN